MHLDYFWELLHPPSTGCVIPGFALHAVLHFPYTNLPPPSTVKRIHNYIPVAQLPFRHRRVAK